MGLLFRVFTGVALFIACLGLFGLASFMAEQRTKEIGIRKVLGASVPGIVTLLSREFTQMGAPGEPHRLAGGLSRRPEVAREFRHPDAHALGLFLLAAGLALAIAQLTVSYQSVRAATANPVESLRYE